jgi:hypothetical protein
MRLRLPLAATPAEKKVVFLSVPGPGPRFRLTYACGAPGEIRILFEITPPGAPESFRRYGEGTARRRGR